MVKEIHVYIRATKYLIKQRLRNIIRQYMYSVHVHVIINKYECISHRYINVHTCTCTCDYRCICTSHMHTLSQMEGGGEREHDTCTIQVYVYIVHMATINIAKHTCWKCPNGINKLFFH